MSRILIAEDEPRIAAFVDSGLRAAGYATLRTDDGRAALEHARSGRFDLMVLDLGLPGYDGMEVLTQLRREGNRVPVIILSARASVAERVAGLAGGADDYLPKPFAFAELLARVKVRLRPSATPDSDVLISGSLSLDLRTHQATVAGRSVELTAREFALAWMLMRHPDQVLSREQLLNEVWGLDFDPGSNIVDVYVGNLRRKLGTDRIATVRGTGYRLIADTDPASAADPAPD